jgi:hypothetical protein
VRYLGSGTVDGTLLGQYAMDEYQGMLRVASTVQPDVVPGHRAAPGAVSGEGGSAGAEAGTPTMTSAPRTTILPPRPRTTVLPPMPRPTVVPPVPAAPSSGSVTVLRLAGGALEQVGRLDGLGRDEAVQGVRFAGPLAYVVTFRQTDPLFVVDLADPAHPRVAGSVDLLGYSAYLHPLGNGLLLGVGQDATTDGARTGVQLSLFDVSDPARPQLLDRVSVPGGWSATEYDPHAFAYIDGVALVPVQSSDGAGGQLLAVRVEGRGLAAPEQLSLDDHGNALDVDASQVRTFGGDGALWTVAPGQVGSVVAAHDTTSLQLLGTTSF